MTQTRPPGLGHSKVMAEPVSFSSPMTPSSGNRRRRPCTMKRWLARSASVTASFVVVAWVLVSRWTLP
jgi:hypothetical protein